jgi:hypothetical protein
MQRAREVFYLYALQNTLTIALSFALGRHSIAGLSASVSIAYSAAAVAAVFVLARHQVNIVSVAWSVHVRRSLWASLFATIVMDVTYNIPSWSRGAGLVARFSLAILLGVVSYGALVFFQQRRSARTPSKDVRLKQF